MPRLLMVTTVPSTMRGFLAPFLKHFSALGWSVDAMAKGISSCPEVVQVCRHVWDINWGRNPLLPGNLFGARRVVQDVVAREQYDLVHVHTPVAAFVTRFALRRLRRQTGTKVIYTAHGFHFFQGGRPLRNALFRTLEKKAGSWTDYLVVINRDDEAAARRYQIVPAERLTYMPGIGIDTARWSPDRVAPAAADKVRESLGMSADAPAFLQVAEFIPRKRQADAVRAFAQLAQPEAHLLLAGQGPTLERVRELARQLRVADRVHFLGYRRDIPALVRAATAVLLVSEQEGLPVSVMEGLSLEAPVIGSDIRGTRELLTDKCGILVPVGEAEPLTQAMAWVLQNPEEAKAMGRRGRSKMQGTFDLANIIKMHEDLYARALGNRPAVSKAEMPVNCGCAGPLAEEMAVP